VENLKNSKNVEVIYLNVNEKGDVDIEQLQQLLKSSDNKTLVSLMHANNEIGNLLDLDKVANICKENGAIFILIRYKRWHIYLWIFLKLW
jgi:cysteine desulfurase